MEKLVPINEFGEPNQKSSRELVLLYEGSVLPLTASRSFRDSVFLLLTKALRRVQVLPITPRETLVDFLLRRRYLGTYDVHELDLDITQEKYQIYLAGLICQIEKSKHQLRLEVETPKIGLLVADMLEVMPVTIAAKIAISCANRQLSRDLYESNEYYYIDAFWILQQALVHLPKDRRQEIFIEMAKLSPKRGNTIRNYLSLFFQDRMIFRALKELTEADAIQRHQEVWQEFAKIRQALKVRGLGDR
jgi:hypothetical protein